MLSIQKRGNAKVASYPFGGFSQLCYERRSGGRFINKGRVVMTKGWPEEYYAVIFTTQRSDAEMELYGLTSQRMIDLAQQQPGFLGLESVREENGLGITVSYWRDRQAIAAWGSMPNIRSPRKLAAKSFIHGFNCASPK